MRKNNFQSLGDVIRQWKTSYGVSERLKNAQAVNAWHSLVGDAITKQTQYVYIKEGVMYVRIPSAALRQELFYAKDKIKKNLNTNLKEEYISDIVFR
ncbi:MAG: DUF721 domain-containing protein [Chitinophagales bacterium]|jgi:predicted nucleic acid-binding Zn ribbon protein|nr:DUF721 domain-containing protein [Sphingobacteriales bacterium]MBP6664705.1 DUF721 domain-containing protein [Chitinophagales bacterium]MBP7534517.1 DUF721 domain-containing protein [Chitinophagales bacterium]